MRDTIIVEVYFAGIGWSQHAATEESYPTLSSALSAMNKLETTCNKRVRIFSSAIGHVCLYDKQNGWGGEYTYGN